MESFGLWYKLTSEDSSNNESDSDKKASSSKESKCPVFDVHVNFWSEDICISKTAKKYKKNPTRPYLDIGIKIFNWTQLQNITFHCPFKVEKSHLKDLSSVLKQKEIEELVFNENCTPMSQDFFCNVQVGNGDNCQYLILFPLSISMGDNDLDPNVSLQDSIGYKVLKKNPETDIVINISSFKKIISKYNYNNLKKDQHDLAIYIRFRIDSNELKNKIYFDSNPIDKSFETAFTNSRIIDFKLNEERNLSTYTCLKMNREDSALAKFKAVHFLVMEPSYYDVTMLSDKKFSCRELEEKRWDEYYGTNIDTKKEHVLAYHFSQKAQDQSPSTNEKGYLESFSTLIKIKSYKTNIRTIFEYILIAIALGVLGNTVYNIFSNLFGNVKILGQKPLFLDTIIIVICTFVIYFAGSSKKR